MSFPPLEATEGRSCALTRKRALIGNGFWTSSLQYCEGSFLLFISQLAHGFLLQQLEKDPEAPSAAAVSLLPLRLEAHGGPGVYAHRCPKRHPARGSVSGFAFPQVAFSKSNNILCVSVARADAARPRIETFLPRRNDSQASRPASLPDNRLSHTTEHFKMPFPKNTKDTCKTHFVSLLFAPVGGICSSRNHIYARSRNGDDDS